jgi:hypothetical protein
MNARTWLSSCLIFLLFCCTCKTVKRIIACLDDKAKALDGAQMEAQKKRPAPAGFADAGERASSGEYCVQRFQYRRCQGGRIPIYISLHARGRTCIDFEAKANITASRPGGFSLGKEFFQNSAPRADTGQT